MKLLQWLRRLWCLHCWHEPLDPSAPLRVLYRVPFSPLNRIWGCCSCQRVLELEARSVPISFPRRHDRSRFWSGDWT